MKPYPIMLDMRGRLAVVVGGGGVGMRKAAALTRAGARVRLVAPRVDESADLTGMEVLPREYDAAMLAGATLVFACTDDRELNSRIAADARAAGALANAADQPQDCDFHVPATIREGDITIAIGTGGAAPALAASLRATLEQCLPPRLAEFAAALEGLRDELRTQVDSVARRGEIMKQLAGSEGYRHFISSGGSGLRDMMERLVASAAGDS